MVRRIYTSNSSVLLLDLCLLESSQISELRVNYKEDGVGICSGQDEIRPCHAKPSS